MESNKLYILSTLQATDLSKKIVLNDNDITDPSIIANAFNKYFANVGKNLANAITEVHKSPFDFLTDPCIK